MPIDADTYGGSYAAETGANTDASETLLTRQTGEGAGGTGWGGKEGAEAGAYTLTAPEGYPISEGALKGLNEVCRSARLNEGQAKAVMAYMQGNYTTAMSAHQEGIQAQAKAWINEFQADREFGGDNFKSSVADARRALATFDKSGTVSNMLLETGYGNNPDVLRIFARVGRALGEDQFIGTGGGGAQDKPLEDRFYPNM